jgi:hypothetical protein
VSLIINPANCGQLVVKMGIAKDGSFACE